MNFKYAALKMCNGSRKYRNTDTVDSTLLTYSWLHFDDKLLFTKHACRVPVCAESSWGHRPTQNTSVRDTAIWSFWVESVDIRCLYTHTLRTITCQWIITKNMSTYWPQHPIVLFIKSKAAIVYFYIRSVILWY
jgi:hypothetical protein